MNCWLIGFLLVSDIETAFVFLNWYISWTRARIWFKIQQSWHKQSSLASNLLTIQCMAMPMMNESSVYWSNRFQIEKQRIFNHYLFQSKIEAVKINSFILREYGRKVLSVLLLEIDIFISSTYQSISTFYSNNACYFKSCLPPTLSLVVLDSLAHIRLRLYF